MPKPLSEDLRKRVIDYKMEGLNQRKIADILKVSTSFVSRLLLRYREEKTIKPKIPKQTRPRIVDYEKARRYIEDNPDKTLKEMGKVLGTKDMFYIMKQLGFTNKKKTSNTLKEMQNKEKNS
jgi:transposase